MTPDHELLRVTELASDAALAAHMKVWGVGGTPASGMNQGHNSPSTATCNHPDCALVRRLRITMRTDELTDPPRRSTGA